MKTITTELFNFCELETVEAKRQAALDFVRIDVLDRILYTCKWESEYLFYQKELIQEIDDLNLNGLNNINEERLFELLNEIKSLYFTKDGKYAYYFQEGEILPKEERRTLIEILLKRHINNGKPFRTSSEDI